MATAATEVKKKPVAMDNIAFGALADIIKISTLGQPFKVLKTHMGVYRRDSLRESIRLTYARGGLRGFYQGLFPWGWIECGTKGAVLQMTSSEVEYHMLKRGLPAGVAGGAAGMAGGVVQSYTTLGVTAFMTTVEVTRGKGGSDGKPVPTTMQVAREILRRDGVRGMYRGVHALAWRQMTNWGSRLGIARTIESLLDKIRSEPGQTRKKAGWERIFSSAVGGALACWNNPVEVIRVEQQKASLVESGGYLTMAQAAKNIWVKDGFFGFFRGVVPRVALSVWATLAQVAGCDHLKEWFGRDVPP
ncbi:Citrate/oxoglutarate carrier protein [Diplonema papillatum]|nr:Citrate/oxoglutarate carrier protein [Diplonema papillatum]|eukprot:gene18087-27856_t